MANVLKGTVLVEVDFCVDPSTRILRDDLTWVRADTLVVGDGLVAFDETLDPSNKFRSGRVLGVKPIERPRVRITTTHGTITVSDDHQFVARADSYGRRWRYARDLRPGLQLTFLAQPWETDESRDGGYLAGFFDGEGWCTQTKVGFGQNPGPTLDRVQRLLRERGIAFRASTGSSTAQCELTDGMREALKFLGLIRPPRLMAKAQQLWEGRRTWGKRTPIVKILSVEFLPPGPVIAIETTTKTYISEGFFSHNCAIEAVLVGWFARSPSYIRLAKVGVHSGLASHILGKPYAPDLSDAALKVYLSAIKEEAQATPSGSSDLYDVSKRVVHGSAYCLTPHGMVNNFPKQFKTISQAKKYQDIYFQMAPDVPAWQKAVQRFAYDHGYLGGPGDPPFGHPFGYKHWFYAVASYRKISEKGYTKRQEQGYAVARFNGLPYAVDMGEDAKRCVAFFPQSTGRGILTEAMLRLHDPEEAEPYGSYIGDAYYGYTPLRAPIHDSLFYEFPRFLEEKLTAMVYREMIRPIVQMPNPASWGLGPYLSVDVEVKRGLSWDAMTKVKDLQVEVEPYAPSLSEEEEEVEALQTEVA